MQQMTAGGLASRRDDVRVNWIADTTSSVLYHDDTLLIGTASSDRRAGSGTQLCTVEQSRVTFSPTMNATEGVMLLELINHNREEIIRRCKAKMAARQSPM